MGTWWGVLAYNLKLVSNNSICDGTCVNVYDNEPTQEGWLESVTISPHPTREAKDPATWCCVVRRLLSGSSARQIVEESGSPPPCRPGWYFSLVGYVHSFQADAEFSIFSLYVRPATDDISGLCGGSGDDYVNEILERLAQRCWELWKL